VLALHRAWVVSLPVSLVAWLVSLAAIISFVLFRQSFIPGIIVRDLVALALLPSIIRYAAGLWLALSRGYWTRKGVPVRRSEQPVRYWSSTVVALVALSVTATAAIFLVLVGGRP
jgi:hypothetical protein